MLPESPVSLALDDVVPHIIVQSLRLRVGEFESHLAKRLLQQYRRKAVVSQANRKQLRWTVHCDLNRLPTAGRLWCAYVAPRVSVDCYRPIAAAGRRAGCAGS